MKKLVLAALIFVLSFALSACGLSKAEENSGVQQNTEAAENTAAVSDNSNEDDAVKGNGNMKIKITVGDAVLYATLEDNAAARAWAAQMPMTLPMKDLYSREMCYRYGSGALPTDELRSDGYEVGDIAYWPPRGSLVILYAQNGEHFERQQIGHIDSGIEVFQSGGDADVTFERVE